MSESFDVQRLVGWTVPDTRHRYTRRDSAFYALSIAADDDPLDTGMHRFIDPWAVDFCALPSMALVLGYPGFWLGEARVRNATGLRPEQVLHAQQAIVLDGPLPVEAEVVGRTSVTALLDKGEGRGALLYSSRSIHRTSDGVRLATCRQVHYLRGAGGCGSVGKPPDEPFRESGGDPMGSILTTTRPDQALLYRLNGDANRLHLDPAMARAAGFDKPILHGMCTAAIAARSVTRGLLLDQVERVRAIHLRMTAPVIPGDSLVTEFWRDGAFRTLNTHRDQVAISGGVMEFD